MMKLKSKTFTHLSNILKSIDLPCLTTMQKGFCEIKLREKELCNALKSTPSNKTLGNDGLRKELYEAFWNKLKDPILKSFDHAKSYITFFTSKRQGVIKHEKDRNIKFMKNWKPI